jgi:methylmalonyl-CoA mutase N-terminal domain/subunit
MQPLMQRAGDHGTAPPPPGPPDAEGRDEIGFPGIFPFTRGIQPTMYRGRPWTMRQYAGFGTAAESNRRYRYLQAQGVTGLSVAFDLPTQIGYDSDHPLARGEVGRVGVAIDSVEDMAALFDGIALDTVSTSMTINATAIVLLAMYVAVAARQGVKVSALAGTVQNDILKEYVARGTFIYPPRPSLRIVTDIVAYCEREVPQWNSISVSGYHIREAGATAVQELAFTLADGFTYVEKGIERGLAVDEFAPRLSFFWDVHNDFFEEIAKLRAARRIWARRMRERYGARDPRSWMMRFHSQTAGVTLTAQQPMNNIVRVAYQAMAAVLGGTQSLHTNSMDETLALPTEQAVQVALRTQQILAYETGVPNVIDPLGGSYYVESLTNEMERGAEELFGEIDNVGGVVKALESGWLQRRIAESAMRQQWEVEQHRKVVVGVNELVTEEPELTIPLLKVGEDTELEQRERLAKLRATRDAERYREAIDALRDAARTDANLIPYILDAARADATLYEIRAAMEEAFGAYREPVFF